MKTLLVLSPHPETAEAIRAGLDSGRYRVVHRVTQEDAEPLLVHGLAQACIIDLELTGVQGVWMIEWLRRRQSNCPYIVFTGDKQSEWEEEAYKLGVAHVLTKPIRPRILATLLDRIFSAPAAPAAPQLQVAPPPQVAPAVAAPPLWVPQTNTILKNFSSILSFSLNADALLRQFLMQLREIVSINRAAIFLRPAEGAFDGISVENRRLRPACAIGLVPGALDQFELSLDAGIGRQLLHLGRILRRHSEEARVDAETQREFETLGGQVAIPILDRDSLIGVAVFDGRITGEPLANSELELVYHLLEHLALAVRNIRLHDQLAQGHEMMTGVLRELSSGCVVISRDLKILHANKMARKYFAESTRASDLEFTDLPQALAAKVYQVLRTGAAITPFRFEPEGSEKTVYHVAIVPFQRQEGNTLSALLTVEDLTQSEQLKRLEMEAANLRLVKTMADRLAHEIGNAMVPLSTHQQLLAEKYRDPEFRASLDTALAEGVKRVTRLLNQMRFLARDSVASHEQIQLSPLIEEAYQEARKFQPGKTAQLKCEGGKVSVTGDRAALKHAFTEILINALQANPADAKVGVRLETGDNGETPSGLRIEVQDNGAGFTPEAVEKASSPFYTTRNVGLGLGLAVTRKIIETHHGKLEIVPAKSGRNGVVRISLPLEPARA